MKKGVLCAAIPVVLMLGACASSPTVQTRTQEYRGLMVDQLRHSKKAIQAAAAPASIDAYRRGTVKLNVVTRSIPAAKAKEVEDAFSLDMAEMLAKCEAVLSRFEGRADRARKAQLATALVGTFAGAVIVPALSASANASKSAIAGWGGLSGATNTAQHLIKDVGLDAASVIAARQKVADKLAQAVKDYTAAAVDNNEAKQDAILSGYSACIAYSVTTAGDISNSVAGASDADDGKDQK